VARGAERSDAVGRQRGIFSRVLRGARPTGGVLGSWPGVGDGYKGGVVSLLLGSPASSLVAIDG
jgi:hypothetical protein